MLLNCGVGEDSWEFLDFMEINPVNPKGNQSWLFIGRTDADTPILWPPDAKNWLIGKNPDAGKDWRQEEKGTTEDEMVGLHAWLDAILGMSLGHEFDQTLGVGDGQGSLACCIPWGCKESHTTEWLNWMERISWRPWGLIWQGEMYVALGHVLKEPLSDPWKLTRRETGRLRCLPHCKQRARSQSKAAQDCGDAKTIRKVPSYPEKRRTRRCLNSSTSTSLVLWGQKPLVFLLRDLFIPDFVCLGKRRMTEKIT